MSLQENLEGEVAPTHRTVPIPDLQLQALFKKQFRIVN